MKKSNVIHGERLIVTTYYNRRKVVRVNKSCTVNSAVMTCTHHMHLNHYGATSAEIYDGRTGKLYSVIKRHMNGHLETLLKAEPKEGQ